MAVSIQIDLDSGSFVASATKANDALKGVQQTGAATQAALDALSKAFAAGGAAADKLGTSAGSSTSALVSFGAAAQRLTQSLQSTVAGIANLEGRLGSLNSGLKAAAGGFNTLSGSARNAGQAVQSAGTAATTFSARSAGAGQAAAALGTNLGRISMAATNASSSFARASGSAANFGNSARTAATQLGTLFSAVQAQGNSAVAAVNAATAAMNGLSAASSRAGAGVHGSTSSGMSSGGHSGAGLPEFMAQLRDATIIAEGFHMAVEGIRSVTEGFLGKITEAAAGVQKMTFTLAAMSKAADPMADATKEIAELREQAKNAPFSLEAMHAAFIRLKTTGMEAKPVIQGVTDAIAAFGGSDEELRRASFAIQEMAGKGVVQLKELRNQLGIAIPGAAKIMADAFGLTYGELMEDVHLGTVDATSAIAGFTAELERSFGGKAQQMMQTFGGQIARLKVNFTDLSLKFAGEDQKDNPANYMNTITAAITRLNDAMSSSTAKQMASELGDGFAKAIQMLEDLIVKAVAFRGELASAAEVLAVGFAGRLAIAGIVALRVEALGLATAFRSGAAAASAVSATIAARNVQLAGMQAVAAALGQSVGPMASLSTGAANLASRIGLVAGGFMRLVPYLPLIGLGIYELANYFGMLRDRAREAYEEMDKFGGKSAEETKRISEDFIRSLDDKMAFMQRMASGQRSFSDLGRWLGDGVKDSFSAFGMGDGSGEGGSTDYAKGLKDKADAQLKQGKQVADAQMADARTYAEARVKAVEESETGIRNSYRKTKDDAAALEQQRINALTEAGHSTVMQRQAYGQDVRDNQLKFYDQEIEAFQKEIDAQVSIAKEGDEAKRKNAEAAIIALKDKQDQIREQRKTQEAAPLDIQLNKKEMADDALFKKGDEALLKLRENIEGYKAGISGADVELAKLQEKLTSMPYGDPLVDRVKALIENLKAATKEAEDLKAIMSSKDKLDDELNSAGDKAHEEYIKATKGDETPTEKIARELNEGKFKGYGGDSDEAKRLTDLRRQYDTPSSGGLLGSVTALTRGIDATTVAGEQAGLAIKDKAFGTDALAAATRMADAVNKVAEGMGAIGTRAGAASDAIVKMGSNPALGGLSTAPLANQPGAGLPPGASGTRLGAAFDVNGPRVQQTLSPADRDRMTRTLLGEAGGEGDVGMAAVANVIKNRVSSGNYADGTYAGVINQPKQFSMWNAGNAAGRMANAIPADSEKYQRAARIVDLVTSGSIGDPTNGATHYMNPRDADRSAVDGWGAKLGAQQKIVIGNHEFLGKEVSSQPWTGFTPNVAGIAAQGQPAPTAAAAAGPTDPKLIRTKADPVDPRGSVLAGDPRPAAAPGSLDAEQVAKFKADQQDEIAAAAAKAAKAMSDKEREAAEKIREVNDKSLEGMGEHEATARREIRTGKFSSDVKVTDDDNPVFASYLAHMKELDESTKAAADQKKAQSEADGKLKSSTDELAKLQEKNSQLSQQLMGNPNDPKLTSAYLNKQAEGSVALDKQKAAYGSDSTQYADQAKLNTQVLQQQRNQDILNDAQGWRQKTIAMQESLMGQDAAQADAHQREIERIQKELSEFQGSSEQKKALTDQANQYIAASNATAMAKQPIGQAIQQWSDYSKNIQTSIVSSANTAMDGVAAMIVGKTVNWQSMLQNAAQSMISALLKGAVGNLFGGLMGGSSGTGGFGSLFGSKSRATPAATPVAHTGGIIGGSLSYRMADMSMFHDAPRFHTGGIVGSDEVPIIARKGEGVFTPEQMSAMGGQSGGHTIHSNTAVTINANGGSKEQNADLAHQVGKTMETHFRGVIVDELSRQMRPGNMLAENPRT